MAITVANPGNLVVPLSTIIDQLRGKLTAAEIEALLLAIVGGRRQQVQPGDLITADLFNQILADIADLNLRVAALQAAQPGQGQGVLIFSPTVSTVLRVGDPLVIQGQNLLSSSIVLIENTSVAGVAGSSNNTRLTVARIPPIDVPGGLPAAGRQVRLTVSNTAGQAEAAFVLRPAELSRPIGSIIVAQSSGPTQGTTFEAGRSYTYGFLITADTRPDTTFQVTTSTGAPGWTATPSQSEMLIQAAPDAQTPTVRTLSVTVTIPPGAQDGDTGRLRVTLTAATDPTFTWSSAEIPITVNDQAGQTRELNLVLTTVTAGQAAIRTNPDNSRTPLIGAAGGGGGTGQVNLTVTRVDGGDVDGDYDVNLARLGALEGDLSPPRWQASLAATSGSRVTLAGSSGSLGIELTAASDAQNATLVVELTHSADPTVSGLLELPVERRA